MTDEVKAAAAEAQKPEAAPFVRVDPPEPTHEERVKALLAGYEHGMNSNSPRTSAELAELKALLQG